VLNIGIQCSIILNVVMLSVAAPERERGRKRESSNENEKEREEHLLLFEKGRPIFIFHFFAKPVRLKPNLNEGARHLRMILAVQETLNDGLEFLFLCRNSRLSINSLSHPHSHSPLSPVQKTVRLLFDMFLDI
jgi:hypothetical protein